MGRSHVKGGLFQMVWVLYLGITAQAQTVGNSNDTKYTSLPFETEIDKDNVNQQYLNDTSDKRSLERQEITKSEWTSPDQTKDLETSFRSSKSTEPSLENQHQTDVIHSQTTSNYVSRVNTLDSITLLSQYQEITDKEASCSHKCGQIQSFPCSCDLRCLIHQNCCEDINVVCPEIFHESQIRYGHMLGMKVVCSSEEIFLITECVQNTIQGIHKGRSATEVFILTGDYEIDLTNVMGAINGAYVTDTTTGFVYKNMDVFSCAALENSRPLRWSVIFQASIIGKNKDIQDMIASMAQVQRPLLEPPKELGANLTAAPCILNAVGTCLDGWARNDSGTVSKCQQFVSYVSVGEMVYRNKYCLLCRGISLDHQILSVLESKPDRNDFDFSLTMSLSGNSLNVIAKIKTAVFVENECAISTETQTNLLNAETKCSSENCDIFSLRRQDGVCKRVYEMMIAVADDGFPFTADVYEQFPEFLYCYIKSDIPELDIDDNFYPTVPLFDNTLNATLYITRMFLFQASLSDEAFITNNFYSKLSFFSQQYKTYRKTKVKLDETPNKRHNNSQLNQIRTRLMLNSEDGNLLQDGNSHNRFGSLTTTCYCTRQLDTRVDYFHHSCDLKCFQAEGIDDVDILSTTKLTRQCRSSSGGQRQLAGPVSVYIWAIYLFLNIIIVNGFI